MTEIESSYPDAVAKMSEMTTDELDQKLEGVAIMNEQTNMLLCCYLAGMRERKGYLEFGYSDIVDYAKARFGFGDRKTRYLVSLGLKIERLPKIRAALENGKLGWCKAVRIASVAARDDEEMWLQSALSLSVKDLERRINDRTDTLSSVLNIPLNEDRRILWEHVLEIFRRRAGAEISPVQAFEYMLAEAIATWGHYVSDADDEPEATEAEAPEKEEEESAPPQDDAVVEQPVFPWAAHPETKQVGLWEDERAAENEFAATRDYNEVRNLVLERDGWKCAYPGCEARTQLHVHHIKYRSRGGSDAPWNLTVVCDFHHKLIHSSQIAVTGRAPLALEWTPPKLMRAVLDRRRNNPSLWAEELDVREWSLETRAVGVT